MLKQEVSVTFIVALIAFTVVFGKFIVQFVFFIIAPYLSPLRTLPGPPFTHWMNGWTMPDIMQDLGNAIQQKHKEFGTAFYGVQTPRTPTLYIIDEEAVHYVLQNQYSSSNKKELFRRQPLPMRAFAKTFGATIVGSEAEIHKRHRKAFSPAFSEASIRQTNSMMFEVTKTLLDVIRVDVNRESDSKYVQIDILEYLKQAALDMIGEAGFGESLGALKKERTKLFEHFQILISMVFVPSKYILARFQFPWLATITKHFVPEEGEWRRNKELLDAYSEELLQKAEKEEKQSDDHLTIVQMTKRNVTNSVGKPSLSARELRESVSTLLFAGSETTATTLAWALYQLTSSQEGLKQQEILRTELKAEKNQNWRNDFSTLNKLPYLDAICTEVIRMHSAATMLGRVCIEDTIIPLGTEVTLLDGTKTKQIPIKRGEQIEMSIQSINKSEALWGKDAKKFFPERWLKEDHPLFNSSISNQMTDKARRLGGWNHLLTFGQGSRMCIGFRMAVAEIKIILANCIDQFDWKAAIDQNTGEPFPIEGRGRALYPPVIKGAPIDQPSLPISVKSL